MYLVTFSLATHLNAALAGLPVEFGAEALEGCRKALWNTTHGIKWEFDLSEFAISESIRSPNEWLDAMNGANMERAWFTFGRDRRTAGDGILVERGSEQWFFRSRYEKRSLESPNEIRFSPVRPSEDILRPPQDVGEATNRLIEGIDPILDLALKNSETTFSVALKRALHYASSVGKGASTEEVSPLVSRLYPRGTYPVDHQLLMSAWTESQILGGVGSWNDGPVSPDPASRAEHEKVTRFFADSRRQAEDVASWYDFRAGNRS